MFGAPIKEIVTLDGMRIVFEGGFALIRQSNTEPVFTLRFEAPTRAQAEQFKKAMTAFLDKKIISKLFSFGLIKDYRGRNLNFKNSIILLEPIKMNKIGF